MKALSIRQPWAWLVVRPDLVGEARASAIERGELKDIENRTWPTRYRGRVLIHASKGMTRAEYDDVEEFLTYDVNSGIALPERSALERGGIVGVATITDCVASMRRSSPWHIEGQHGFHIADARPLPFVECKGALGFFDVPPDVAETLRQWHTTELARQGGA
jgi:hypothetical protein